VDETTHFSGYIFTFESEGKILADSGMIHNVGTWTIADNSSSDDSQEDMNLVIHFNLSNDFEEPE